MLTVLTNLKPDFYMWTCTIWMTSFAASGRWIRNSEEVFINQLNFWPTPMGKHDCMGICFHVQLISKQIAHPYICNGLGYLAWQLSCAMLFQWGLTNRKPLVRQLSAATSSVWRTLLLIRGLTSMGVKTLMSNFIPYSYVNVIMYPCSNVTAGLSNLCQ